MARGAKTITIDDEDEVCEIEVTLWVDAEGGLKIGISDENLRDTFPMQAALKIMDAIKKLYEWSSSLSGMKRILEMQEAEQLDMDSRVIRLPKKKKSAKKKKKS